MPQAALVDNDCDDDRQDIEAVLHDAEANNLPPEGQQAFFGG